MNQHPQGLPPLWEVLAVIVTAGAILAALIELGTWRQRRYMDSLWAAARRHQLREHEALVEILTAQARQARKPAPPRAEPEAITVELEVIKLDGTEER